MWQVMEQNQEKQHIFMKLCIPMKKQYKQNQKKII